MCLCICVSVCICAQIIKYCRSSRTVLNNLWHYLKCLFHFAILAENCVLPRCKRTNIWCWFCCKCFFVSISQWLICTNKPGNAVEILYRIQYFDARTYTYVYTVSESNKNGTRDRDRDGNGARIREKKICISPADRIIANSLHANKEFRRRAFVRWYEEMDGIPLRIQFS